jgi:hypothetical protein
MDNKLALKVFVDLQPLLTPALDAKLPKTYEKIKEVRDYCSEIYMQQFIDAGCKKDCCS